MWCSWVVLASGLKSRHRSRFDKLLLCCFWIAPVEPSKATYGSSHLVAAGWACDKWQWWLHGQDWRICVHFKYTLWKGASSKSQHCGGPVNCQKKKRVPWTTHKFIPTASLEKSLRIWKSSSVFPSAISCDSQITRPVHNSTFFP